MFNLEIWAEYTVWGVLGAVAHLLVMRFAWEEKTYPVRELGLAIILAFVISQLGLPNRFTTFGIAFLGVDAIEAFLRRIVGQVKEDGS